jgi:hypothetical protein
MDGARRVRATRRVGLEFFAVASGGYTRWVDACLDAHEPGRMGRTLFWH